MDNKQRKVHGRFVIVLHRDETGPTYLGQLDLGRQGVRRLDNAIRYKTRGRALRIAAEYGATVEPIA